MTNITGNEARVNGTPIAPGETLFPGDIVRIDAGSSAALQFGGDLVVAAPETEFLVSAGAIALRRGCVQVRARAGVKLAPVVYGPFFRIELAATGSQSSSVEVRLAGSRAAVSAFSGAADVFAAGHADPYELRAGEMATLDAADAGAAQASHAAAMNRPAGTITRLVPGVRIDRYSVQLVASASGPVLWNDDLLSDRSGRAHITLNDGSELYLGSDSDLRILQHDAAAQQTSLDLLIGRLRGKVSKITRPDGKFEIRTPVGVAGLVGTDFSLAVTGDYVELMVFEGAVQFTLDSNGRKILVPAPKMIRIYRNGTVQGPTDANPEEVEFAKSETDIPQLATQAQPQQPGKARLLPIVVRIVELVGPPAAIGAWLAYRSLQSPSSPQ